MAKRVAGDLYFDIDGQLLEIKRQLRQREGYPYDPMQLVEHLQAAIEGTLVDRHGRLFQKEADGKQPAGNTYLVSVDYGLSVEDAVKLGRYDWTNSEITSKHFPTNRKGKADVAVELIHFNRVVSTDEALRELDKAGYRPAELHELLAFGEKYSELQREFPIVALGSVWQDRYGNRFVPYLYGDGSERYLDLRWLGHAWIEVCRFAAVRK